MIARSEFFKRKEQQQHHHHHDREQQQQHRLLKHSSHGAAAAASSLQQQPWHHTLAPAPASPVAAMRDPPHHRTKVVVRHLPPTLSHSAFLEQIESRFAGLYNWVSFCPGKLSVKGITYSRAYIDFKHPEDVFDFYDVLDGHVFVNEKGTQYRALVEYAPYQRVPKLWSKKDVREGGIFKDPEYLEFLEVLAKPVEYLPSAEVQLERKEAERNSNLATVGAKEAVIVTPLMEYVRQKRALKSAPQRLLGTSGKLTARGGGLTQVNSSNLLSKRGADRSRANSMYVPSQLAIRVKEKSTYVPRREEIQRRDRESFADKKRRELLEVKDKKLIQEIGLHKVVSSNQDIDVREDSADMDAKDFPEITLGAGGSVDGNDTDQHLSGKVSLITGVTTGLGKEGSEGRILPRSKVLLVKEKEKESPNGSAYGSSVSASDGAKGPLTLRHRGTPSMKISPGSLTAQQSLNSAGRGGSLASKPNQRRDGGGRLGRVAALSRDSPLLQQHRLSSDIHSDKDKHLPRPQMLRANSKELKAIPVSASAVCEFEPPSQQNNLSSSGFTDERQEVIYGDEIDRQDGGRVKNKDRPDRPVWTVRRHGDVPTTSDLIPSPAAANSSLVLGNQRQTRRDRVFHHVSKESDGSLVLDASKPAKRGGLSTYGGHEKQVWVAKSGSG